MSVPTERSHRFTRLALCFTIVYPSLLTWIYFIYLKDQASTWQLGVYGVGKVVQFVFPAVFVLWTVGSLPRRPQRPFSGMGPSVLFGLFVLIGMMVLYHFVFVPLGVFNGPDEQVREKIRDLGLNQLPMYILMGLFYSLFHSFLEEYYWRWFVFDKLRDQLPSTGWAIFFSSIGFMAHHVIVVSFYFGATSFVTYLFCAGVAFGGAVWALLYHHYRSLIGPWVSHAFVDAAIFVIGYFIARDLFA